MTNCRIREIVTFAAFLATVFDCSAAKALAFDGCSDPLPIFYLCLKRGDKVITAHCGVVCQRSPEKDFSDDCKEMCGDYVRYRIEKFGDKGLDEGANSMNSDEKSGFIANPVHWLIPSFIAVCLLMVLAQVGYNKWDHRRRRKEMANWKVEESRRLRTSIRRGGSMAASDDSRCGDPFLRPAAAEPANACPHGVCGMKYPESQHSSGSRAPVDAESGPSTLIQPSSVRNKAKSHGTESVRS